MKLRLKGDSVRLRLGPGEVDQLVRAGTVVDQTRFGPDQALGYALAMDPDGIDVTVAFARGQIRVTVPFATARHWAASADQVEISANVDVGGGRHLSVLIEKDFKCLHGDDRDVDVYPNPQASAGTP
jgi:hypothetical protein